MTDKAPTFTLQESINAQRALRTELGLGEESFDAPEFVGMISDEIEKLRAVGKTDADIVAVIGKATGKSITEKDIADHYVTPEDRHPEKK